MLIICFVASKNNISVGEVIRGCFEGGEGILLFLFAIAFESFLIWLAYRIFKANKETKEYRDAVKWGHIRVHNKGQDTEE